MSARRLQVEPFEIDPAEAGCQIILISPPRLDPAAGAERLDVALTPGGIAAFLLRLDAAGAGVISAAAERLGPVCAAHGVAFLLQDEAALALELGADGVHLGSARRARTAAARTLLGPERIVGAGCGLSRDAAMLVGEHGADYIGFGDPDRPPDPQLFELIGWWSELFVLPCLAEGAPDLEACAALAGAGADFIGVSGLVWRHRDGPAAGVAAVCRAIARA